MERTLILHLPEEVYTPLAQTAEQEGRTPELLAVEWISAALQQITHDPLEEFIGAFSSRIPDWTEKHDEYLGTALLEEMDNEPEKP